MKLQAQVVTLTERVAQLESRLLAANKAHSDLTQFVFVSALVCSRFRQLQTTLTKLDSSSEATRDLTQKYLSKVGLCGC